MNRTTTKSPFAEALEGLIDGTELFKRREWAKLLGIKESAISQWLSEDTIPRATNLNMLFTTLEQSSDVPKEPIEAFRAIAHRPALEVSPKNGRRMLPTVWEYMKRPLFNELSNKLARLSPAEQEKLLEERFSPEVVTPVSEAPAETAPAGVEASTPTQVRPEPSPEPSMITVPTGVGKTHTPATERILATHHGSGHGRGHFHADDQRLRPRHDYITPTFRLSPHDTTGQAGSSAVSWEQISQTSNHVLVVGSPGVGKSSFLLHLLHLLRDKPTEVVGGWAGRTPRYVALHRLATVQSPEDLLGEAQDEESQDTPPGRLLLLLDGFDEVQPERRESLARAVSAVRDRSPETCIVVTSRPTPDVSDLGRMTRCSIQAPSDSRLLAWACKEASSAVAGSDRRWDDALLRFGSCFRERPDVFRAVGNPLLLSYSARLFAKRALTASHDADLLDSCLTYLLEWWDEEKNVVRSRSPRTSTRTLCQWLGNLCYHSLVARATDFNHEQVVLWFKDYPARAPVEADLRAVSESTGIIEPSQGDRWRIAHQTFQEYLAARFVVESSREATDYLRQPVHEPWMSRVLKFACSITPDATALLRFVLDSPWTNRADKMSTLADMMAQQITAADDVVERGCDELVGWLDESFADWTITNSEEESVVFPEPKWRLTARSRQPKQSTGRETGKHLLRAIQAVHRTRLSPTKPQLTIRLVRSENPIVQSVGESLSVEGYLQGQAFSRGEADVLAATVSEF